MSEQLPPTRDSEIRDAHPEAEPPSNLAWHLDGLHQRRMRQLERRARSPINVPAWSLGLTLLLVMVAAGAMAYALFALRSNEPRAAAEPLISVTNVTDANENLEDELPANSTESSSEGIQIIIAAQTPANLKIDGPVLPTVVITLTPIPLAVGASVEVAGVGADELNIRNLPGLIDSTILFRAPEGTAFDVIDGPQQADGFTWWKIRDTQFQVQGWAAANYLQVVR